MRVETNISSITSNVIKQASKLDELDKRLAVLTRYNFVNTYTAIMDDFYAYHPKYYKRSSINPLRNIGRGYLRENVGGVIISPNFSMRVYADYKNKQGRHIKITTDNVMDLMWNHGVRGLPPGYRGSLSFIASITSPFGKYNGTPYGAMNKYVRDYIDKYVPEITKQYIADNVEAINFE